MQGNAADFWLAAAGRAAAAKAAEGMEAGGWVAEGLAAAAAQALLSIKDKRNERIGLHIWRYRTYRRWAFRADARRGGVPSAAVAGGALRFLGAPARHRASCTDCRSPVEGFQRFAGTGGRTCLALCNGRR